MSHEPADIAEQLRRTVELLGAKFGHAGAKWAAAAPGRVNLIGEHTDYNDGFVLPMAIQRQTLAAAAQASGPAGRIRVVSTNQPQPAEFVADASLANGQPAWANYVRGVFAGFVERGANIPALDVAIDSTVPLGGGLSSSASLEVAVATLLESVTGVKLSAGDKSTLCQMAEHRFAGVPCGIMDQSIATMAEAGHAMLLDCRSLATKMVPLADPSVAVLIANTNVKHELTGGEYAERRGQCEAAAKALGAVSLRDVSMKQLTAARATLDPLVYRRAYHVIGEIARTLQAADATGDARWADFGILMGKSHRSLRDDFEVSCAELDVMVELAQELGIAGGVFGSRMTGGGFGGCTVSLVRADAIDKVTAHLQQGYKAKTGIEPTIFATRPAAGARVLGL